MARSAVGKKEREIIAGNIPGFLQFLIVSGCKNGIQIDFGQPVTKGLGTNCTVPIGINENPLRLDHVPGDMGQLGSANSGSGARNGFFIQGFQAADQLAGLGRGGKWC